MKDLTDFITARLDEAEAHAHKDLWAVSRATAEGRWTARYGYNVPHSYLAAEGAPPRVYIAEFTAHRSSPPLADGEDDLHAADVLLAARMASGARSRAERMLRDVAAKRAILAEYDRVAGSARTYLNKSTITALGVAQAMVKALGAAWDNHPGYRSEWAA